MITILHGPAVAVYGSIVVSLVSETPKYSRLRAVGNSGCSDSAWRSQKSLGFRVWESRPRNCRNRIDGLPRAGDGSWRGPFSATA